MALGLYREVSTGTYAVYKQDDVDDGSLPIITTHDGVLGETIETKFFIRNDDSSQYYTDISVLAVCKTSPDDTIGVVTGHGTKLYAGKIQPTEAEWEAIDYANTITLSNIGSSGYGDTSTYLPVWYRVEVPAGTPADNKENIILRISFTAHHI